MVLPIIATVLRAGSAALRASGSLRGANGIKNVRKDAARMKRNITKRVARVEEAGLKNYATDEFKRFAMKQLPTTDSGWREYRNELKRINKLAGTAVRTAKTAHALFTNDQERAKTAKDPLAVSQMSEDEQKKLFRSLKRSFTNQIDNTEAADGESQSIDRARDILDRVNDPDTADKPFRRASAIKDMFDASQKKRNTPQGAKDAANQGADFWGADYQNWTKEQRSAAWDAFHRFVQARQVASDVIYASLSANGKSKLLKDGALTVEFRYRNNPATGLPEFDGAHIKVIDNDRVNDVIGAEQEAATAQRLSTLEDVEEHTAPHRFKVDSIDDQIRKL